MGAAPMDTCSIEYDGGGMTAPVAMLHVPTKPEAMWRARDRERRTELQMAMDPAVIVPVWRPEHFDLSVEWTVTNLTDTDGEFRVDMNAANEEFAYDPTAFMLADDEDPPPPPLQGNIPIHLGPNGVYEGVFREDQLLESAIDLDQITRGNVNPFKAMLTINKNDDGFQPLTPVMYDANGDQIMGTGEPTGPAIPMAALRQIIRIDMSFRPDRMMRLDFTIRVREHVEIIHEEGLNAPAAELDLRNPAAYAGTL
jgi:hypothetical protein